MSLTAIPALPPDPAATPKPQWLADLHVFNEEKRCEAENVLRYYQYVNQRLAEQTVLNDRIQLWFHFVAESHTLFQHADQHLDAQGIGQLEDYLSTIQFKSIPRFLQTPTAKAKVASVRLQENWQSLTPWFQGDLRESFVEHCVAPMTDLTADLWLDISKFMDPRTLRCLAQTSRYMYLFTWREMTDKLYLYGPNAYLSAALIPRTHNLQSLYILANLSCSLSLMEHIKNPLCLTTLNLSGCSVILNRMCDSLPQFLMLKTLDLSQTSLFLGVVEKISSLTNLTDLNLCSQNVSTEAFFFSHSITYDVSPLAGLTKLRRLSFAANEAEIKPGTLQALTNLQAGCFLFAGPELLNELWPLTNLRSLSIGTNPDKTDAASLNYMLLQKIELERLRIFPSLKKPDLTVLPALTRLTHLDIPGSGTDQLLQELTALTRLANLGVGGSLLTDEGLSHIVKLTKLVGLSLAHGNQSSKISNEAYLGLTALSNLTTLVVPAREEEGMKELFEKILVKAEQWAQDQ